MSEHEYRNGDRVRHDTGKEGIYVGPIPRPDDRPASAAVAVDLNTPNVEKVEWWHTSMMRPVPLADRAEPIVTAVTDLLGRECWSRADLHAAISNAPPPPSPDPRP